MGGDWISYWIKEVIKNNKGTDYGKSLKAAYKGNPPQAMLAGLVKFVLQGNKYWKPPAELRIAVRPYDPPTGSAMGNKPWANVWYNPTDDDY